MLRFRTRPETQLGAHLKAVFQYKTNLNWPLFQINECC